MSEFNCNLTDFNGSFPMGEPCGVETPRGLHCAWCFDSHLLFISTDGFTETTRKTG